MRLDEIEKKLPDFVAKAFVAIADQQRGDAEHTMLRIQHTYGGGVLNIVVEHGGDLIHRMTEHADHGVFLKGAVSEKVNRCLRYLQHPYGFSREFKENLVTNEVDLPKLDRLMARYSNDFEQIPAYNAAQYAAKETAIAIGRKRWWEAESNLLYLRSIINNDTYTEVASSYTLSKDGKLLSYEESRA